MKQYRQTLQESMVTTSKEPYTFTEKVFCCRCFDCLKQEVVLTSDLRRQTLQRMVNNFAIDYEQTDKVEDSIKLMILIHLSLDEDVPQRFINRCQINPSHDTDHYRTDLQFYIPQIANYLVFHNDLKQNYLSQAIEKAAKLSFYFAQAFYFYLLSLEKIVGATEIQTFKKVTDYRQLFLDQMCLFYQGKMLNSVEHFVGERVKTTAGKDSIDNAIKQYGNREQPQVGLVVAAKDIPLPNYVSIFKDNDDPEPHSFKSTINFFEDLFQSSEELKNFENKKEKLCEFLKQMNLRLPACVYVPFAKANSCYSNVLSIVVEETKIFSTKSRAPFYICLEVYDPIEAFPQQLQKKYNLAMQRPITIKQIYQLESAIPVKSRKSDESRLRKSPPMIRKRLSNQSDSEPTVKTEILKDKNYLSSKWQEYSNDMATQPYLFGGKREVELQLSHKELEKKFQEMFGEDERRTAQRIRRQSIYRDLQSWRLMHLMVKTGDNLKQEQFALQLICQFDYIFKLEQLPLLLTPYEVISMGPDSGIIEMVRDAITLDKLKKNLKNKFQKALSLKECFELYFSGNLVEAKDTFMKSLAAYSLVMYFLQAKDRHNGNILLHITGKIFHIDFGFFLSNLPGKGVQLERDCPFKLLSEYIEVLDGHDSYYFKKFREYLFLGFKAIRRHQNKILLLVKMMYSSSGASMPCFEKGEEAIRQLEARFNPPEVAGDADLNLHCQRLINSSLDNWATKWYDRFQYFAQGIFY